MNLQQLIGASLVAALTAAAGAAPVTSLVAIVNSGGSDRTLWSWSYPAPEVAPNQIPTSGGILTSGLATNAAGELYVSYLQTPERSIRRYSPAGQLLTPFATSTGPLFRSLAIAPNEDVLAVVSGVSESFVVQRFDSSGNYLNTPYTGPANYWIEDVLVTADGKGFALQRARSSPVISSIEIFDPQSGALLGSIPMPPGTTPGTSRTTRDMEIGPDGNLYFITGPNTSLYRVSPTPGAIPFPVAELGMDVDTFTFGPDGLLYAADFQIIRRFALDGTDMGVFTTYTGSGGITRMQFGNAVPAPATGVVLAASVLAARRRRH